MAATWLIHHTEFLISAAMPFMSINMCCTNRHRRIFIPCESNADTGPGSRVAKSTAIKIGWPCLEASVCQAPARALAQLSKAGAPTQCLASRCRRRPCCLISVPDRYIIYRRWAEARSVMLTEPPRRSPVRCRTHSDRAKLRSQDPQDRNMCSRPLSKPHGGQDEFIAHL